MKAVHVIKYCIVAIDDSGEINFIAGTGQRTLK